MTQEGPRRYRVRAAMASLRSTQGHFAIQQVPRGTIVAASELDPARLAHLLDVGILEPADPVEAAG